MTLLADNDNDVVIANFGYSFSRDAIADAQLSVTLGDPSRQGPVTNATNASPIVITSSGHGLEPGQEVVICRCEGNLAANGVQTVSAVTTDTFTLGDSAGSGAFEPGKAYWILAVPGAAGLVAEPVAGQPGVYRAVIPGTVRLIDGVKYLLVTDCVNYNFHSERDETVQVRR